MRLYYLVGGSTGPGFSLFHFHKQKKHLSSGKSAAIYRCVYVWWSLNTVRIKIEECLFNYRKRCSNTLNNFKYNLLTKIFWKKNFNTKQKAKAKSDQRVTNGNNLLCWSVRRIFFAYFLAGVEQQRLFFNARSSWRRDLEQNSGQTQRQINPMIYEKAKETLVQ